MTYESEAQSLTGICSKNFYSLFISLNQDFNENVSISRLVLGKNVKYLQKISKSDAMPGTENVQDFFSR